MRVNLDTIEAETNGEPHVIVWHGVDFTVPAEIPFDACDRILELIESEPDDDQAGVEAYKAARAIVEIVLGADQWDTFRNLRPSLGELVRFQREVVKLYGFDDVGESSASDDSSKTTSNRSRPTSNGSTRSTSGPAATEHTDAASVA